MTLSSCFLSGCGGGLVPVHGRVTLDGKPLDYATVMFIPVGPGRDAKGLADQNGNFRLSTFKSGDGAFPGEYKVIITKTAMVERPPSMRDPAKRNQKPPSGLEMAQAAAQARQQQQLAASIPAIYRNTKTTPVTLQIPKGGDRHVEIRIDSKATRK